MCLSCDAKKPCVVCQKHLTKDFFSAAAWRCRERRRKCLTCQRKTRGFWTCAGCQQRKQRDQYHTFLRRQPSGENGHQMCDACDTRQAQRRKRQRIASKCNARVASLRQRLHREQILQEIKDLIAREVHARKRLAQTDSGTQDAAAAKRPKHSASVVTPHATPHSFIEPLPSTVPHSSRQTKGHATTENLPTPQSQPGKQSTTSAHPHAPRHGRAFDPEVPGVNRGIQVPVAPTRLYEYICPRCKFPCHSGVHTGQVHHRGKCGHTFRVLDGVVAGRQHEHTCPRCGVRVLSAKPHGRIRVKHRTPNGKACSCEAWNVAA